MFLSSQLRFIEFNYYLSKNITRNTPHFLKGKLIIDAVEDLRFCMILLAGDYYFIQGLRTWIPLWLADGPKQK